MKYISFIGILVFCGLFYFSYLNSRSNISGAPPFGIEESQVPQDLDPYTLFVNWKRPDVPVRVGVQVGHWKNDEVPDELVNLKKNTGASGRGVSEVEVNYAIAHILEEILIKSGVQVDILPATVPPDYWADVFVAIHADGSTDASKSGYKFSGPWRDFTGKSGILVSYLENAYEGGTGMLKDNNITKNMRGYYAFNWWKYEHSVHPMTVAVIAETGFLTSAEDQKILIDNPEISAQALAEGLIEYLQAEKLL